MADGLLNVIADRLPGNVKKIRIDENEKYNRWVKAFDMKQIIGESNYNHPVVNSELEINGQKINMSDVKMLDKCFMNEEAAKVINRNVRMWLGKRKTIKLSLAN